MARVSLNTEFRSGRLCGRVGELIYTAEDPRASDEYVPYRQEVDESLTLGCPDPPF
jgi:hypothetical protein